MGDRRERLVRARRQARGFAGEARHLVAMPPRVAAFYVRAFATAVRTRDGYTSMIATRPSDAEHLLALARDRLAVVELGTGTAWTTIALALADPLRRVVSYDPEAHPQRERYLALVDGGTRARIELHRRAGQDAQPAPSTVDFLFVDCAHDRVSTADSFRAWEPAIVPGGVVAFHDYDHPDYPGVREAVEELELRGEVRGGVFVWRKPVVRERTPAG
jgi:predicted O-methyltransferase YrrM